MPGLTFITPIAYDYRYAFGAIRSYYAIADEILIGIDADRLSWMQRPYILDMGEIERFIAAIDVDRKIRIVEENYHRDANPLTNETQERAALSLKAAPGNWVCQIDADEVLLNAGEFRSWLLAKQPVQYSIYGSLLTVFKSFGDQVMVVDPPEETASVATMRRGEFWRGRHVTSQERLLSPLRLLHFSWGRSREEVLQKLHNWGHARDFDVDRFFQFWEFVNLENYTYVRDFHPIKGPSWHALKLVRLDPVPGNPSPAGS